MGNWEISNVLLFHRSAMAEVKFLEGITTLQRMRMSSDDFPSTLRMNKAKERKQLQMRRVVLPRGIDGCCRLGQGNGR